MQIKTALAIGAGITIGVIFGMGVNEDTKCRITGKIRKNLIYALGGEEKKKYTTYRNPRYHTTYAEYYNEKEQGKRRDRDCNILYARLLEFDDMDSACKCKDDIEKYIDNFKAMSVHDLAMMREIPIDYTWDNYGWRKEDLIDFDSIAIEKVNGKFILKLPDPEILMERWK